MRLLQIAPGTSKWNWIEHLFCHIPQNWRGQPLTDRVAIVELIGATTTKAGLKVECALDADIREGYQGQRCRDHACPLSSGTIWCYMSSTKELSHDRRDAGRSVA